MSSGLVACANATRICWVRSAGVVAGGVVGGGVVGGDVMGTMVVAEVVVGEGVVRVGVVGAAVGSGVSVACACGWYTMGSGMGAGVVGAGVAIATEGIASGSCADWNAIKYVLVANPTVTTHAATYPMIEPVEVAALVTAVPVAVAARVAGGTSAAM